MSERRCPRALAPRPAVILAPASPSREGEALVRSAGVVANLFGARLIGLGVAPAGSSRSRSWPEAEAVDLVLDKAERRFAALTAEVRAGAVWRGEPGAPTPALIRLSAAADLIMINARERGSAEAGEPDLHALVTRGARPVLLRPRGAKPVRPERVTVLWDGSAACARALDASLPFLSLAGRVDLVGDKRRPCAATLRAMSDVREALALRGVAVRLPGEGSGKGGDADPFTADLFVMSAWRRPDWLGGLDRTQALVTELNTHVLVSH